MMHEGKENSTTLPSALYVINVGGDNVWLRAVTVGIAVMNNGNNTFRTKWLHNNSAIWPGFKNTITIQQ